MKIRKIEKKDYQQLVLHSKNILNYYNFFQNYNDDLNTALAAYFLNNILHNANYGYVIDYDGIIVGIILARIPSINIPNIFTYEEISELSEGVYVDPYMIEVQDENQNEIRNLEILTNNLYSKMIAENVDLIQNRTEVLFFSILPKHKGRGLSNILWNKLKYDSIENGVNDLFLFTTTVCDYQYYEHKKMQYIKDVLIDVDNANSIQASFLPLPIFGILYYSNNLDNSNYDPIVEEIENELSDQDEQKQTIKKKFWKR